MINKVLIGSTAIQHHFPDFTRKPKDVDYAVRAGIDIEGDNMIIPLVVDNSDTEIASPEMLLTLKISHIFWNELGERNWMKHMYDIQFLLSKGINYDWDLMLELKEFWTDHYAGLIRSNLAMTAIEFFDNAIESEIEHDDLHELVHESPAYKLVLKGEVEPCEHKFNALSEADKHRLVKEEVMVMAYERWPDEYYKKAYFIMFKKYIRNHVPMFMLDYVLRNYHELDRPDFNFIKHINEILYERYAILSTT